LAADAIPSSVLKQYHLIIFPNIGHQPFPCFAMLMIVNLTMEKKTRGITPQDAWADLVNKIYHQHVHLFHIWF